MKVLCAQADITKLNLDLNLKKTLTLMKHMDGKACQDVVPSTFICISVKNDDVPLKCIEKHKLNNHIDIAVAQYSDILLKPHRTHI